MQTKSFNQTGGDGKLRVFSMNVDFPACARAKRIAGAIRQLAGPHWEYTSEMWQLQTLAASGSIKEMITHEGAAAEVLIIAVSSLEHRPVELIQWLDSLAALEPDHSAPRLLIGLLGDDENQPQELDWTVKQLIRCAQKTNRDFIWHWMGEDAIVDLEWLNDDVEMLLRRKQSVREHMISWETAAAVS
jgi:hypothetical protein